jgi:long-chain acyl-CoA synthetase
LAVVDPGAAVRLPDHTAALKLTSGSSGTPRAIALSSRQLVADTVQIFRTMGVGGGDVTLAAIPLSHSYGVGSCLVPLLLAGTPLVVPASTLPAALAEALARARVAHLPAVPAMVRAIATLSDLPRFEHLRVVLSAGAPLAPVDAAAFHAATGRKVHVFYGSSECGGITYDRGEAPVHEEGAVGTALAGVTVEVVDGDGNPLPCGSEGRVRVLSRAAALAILPPTDHPRTLEPGRFLTGDLGRLDAAGRLTLTGRVAEELNVAGRKVHPEEVRRVLLELPGVRGAVVVGVPDPHRGQLVAALIETGPECGLSVHAVLQACRARLAPHKVPRRVVLVDRLPSSERGKLPRDEVLRLLRGA